MSTAVFIHVYYVLYDLLSTSANANANAHGSSSCRLVLCSSLASFQYRG